MNIDFVQKVLDISRRLARIRALEPLLREVLHEAAAIVGAETGCIVLRREDGSFRVASTLVCADAADPGHQCEEQISTSILNGVMHSVEPMLVHDAMQQPNLSLAESVVKLRLRSVLCVPLEVHANAIGAIYLENRTFANHFQDDQIPPLQLFANQIAVLIENATLTEVLEARIVARTQELETARAALEESWTQAVEANRMRTVMLGNIVHDLRAPLTIIIATLLMLKEGEFGPMQPEQVDWLMRARDAASRALNLTNDVFDLTKLEMGGLTLFREDVPMEDFLRSVYNIGLAVPRPDEVSLGLDIQESLPTLWIDPDRIQQVILNLISNALKFTPQGRVVLYAEHRPKSNELILGVRDTGKGIAAEHLSRLFQRFSHIDGVRRSRDSNGLGLAICRELVEMHGGRIWAESTLGTGSDFKFALPIQIPPVSAL